MTRLHSASRSKNLPDSAPAAEKDNMKRQKQVIRSTKDKIKTALEILDTNRDLHPPITTDKENQLFIYHAKLNPKNGTIYVDFTGKFPIRSIIGNTEIFVLYEWSLNAIPATPVKDLMIHPL